MYKTIVLATVVAGSLAGCSPGKSDVDVNENGPLTVEQWRKMDVLVKYELETFERLKEEDQKLRIKMHWDVFMRDVVVPERKKDIPTNY